MLIYLALLLLLSVALPNREANKATEDKQQCLTCKSSGNKSEEINAKCRVSNAREKCSFEDVALLLRNVSLLDLSDNNLIHVPSWIFPLCKSLTSLSLAQNFIKTIKPRTFRNLRNLNSLDLSFSNLRQWRVDRNNELQSLKYLDLTGNRHWHPSEHLLQLKNLTTVIGLTLTKYCNNCSLVKLKADNTKSICGSYDQYSSPIRWTWNYQIQYGKALDFIKVGFWPTCLCDDVCLTHQYTLHYFTAIADVNIKGSFPLYATGSLALLVNVLVILVITLYKSLRDDLAVRLIINVAVCDVLISLGVVLYPKFGSGRIYIDFLHDKLERNNYDIDRRIETFMNIVGTIMTCAVTSQVFGCFITTLDKFLKIVFAKEPDIRIGKRGVTFFLFLSWSLSAIFAVLPVFNVGNMTYYNTFPATPLPADRSPSGSVGNGKLTVGVAAGTQILLIVFQLTSFFLYLPIFIVAKRSGANVGIKREATIAKKIALLVFTNLIFFTVPVVLGVFQHNIWFKFGQNIPDNWQNHALAEYQWLLFTLSVLPVLCVSINSALNPFLYALRHPKIKQKVDTIISICRDIYAEFLVDLGNYIHSNSVQQENSMEMLEVSQVQF